MLAYKLNMMHDEGDTQNLSPVGHNRNTYTRKEKNCGDDSIMFLPFYGHVYDTVIAYNIDLGSNKIS